MTFSTSATLQQAIALHQRGDLAKAGELYAAVLQHNPDHPEALHLSGVLARQRGDAEQAVALIGAALARAGDKAVMLCNLGAALQDLQRYEQALDSYDRAIALQPDYAMALCNRGNSLRNLGRFDEALESYAAALRTKADYPEPHLNRGIVLQQLARHEEALDAFGAALSLRSIWPEALHGAAASLAARGDAEAALEGFDRALQRRPDYAEAWCGRAALLMRAQELDAALESYGNALAVRPGYARAQLGLANVLRAQGKRETAIEAYEQALAIGADAATVAYMLATLGVKDAPGAAPGAYVAALFDQYASKFDQHLQQVLHYRTPGLLVDALQAHLPQAHDLDIMDLGCGTGLCAPLLRPLARTLEGVDLSPRMLDKARELDLYDALYCEDLTTVLRARTASYELLVAADVMGYLGDLEPMLQAAYAALRPSGVLAFSVEASDEAQGFTLRESGRYAHTRGYIEAEALRQGFSIAALEAGVLRQDAGRDVNGLLVVLKRSA